MRRHDLNNYSNQYIVQSQKVKFLQRDKLDNNWNYALCTRFLYQAVVQRKFLSHPSRNNSKNVFGIKVRAGHNGGEAIIESLIFPAR